MVDTRIVIRAFEPRDQPALTAIFNQPGVAAQTLQLPFTTVEERNERFAPTPSIRMLVAEVDGVVVGEAGLHLMTRRRVHVGSIGMGVSESYQGRGAGTALLRALLDLADNWYNLLRVELQVYTDNAPAIRLYQNHGFVIEGTHRAYAFRLGEFVDAFSMARIRTPPTLATQ